MSHCTFVLGLCQGSRTESLKLKCEGVLKCFTLSLLCVQPLEALGVLKNACANCYWVHVIFSPLWLVLFVFLHRRFVFTHPTSFFSFIPLIVIMPKGPPRPFLSPCPSLSWFIWPRHCIEELEIKLLLMHNIQKYISISAICLLCLHLVPNCPCTVACLNWKCTQIQNINTPLQIFSHCSSIWSVIPPGLSVITSDSS